MKMLGRIVMVLVDIILAPVTVPICLVVIYAICIRDAIQEKDFSWITTKYIRLVTGLLICSIVDHIELLKTGNTPFMEELLDRAL